MIIKNNSIFHEITKIIEKTIFLIKNSETINQLEQIKIQVLGKKGFFQNKIKTIQLYTSIEKPKIGYFLNSGKKKIEEALEKQKKILYLNKINHQKNYKKKIDISLPGNRFNIGKLHPISTIIHKIESIFSCMGFSIIEGPEIEDVYHNFDALNIPMNHPSRNHHDSFWINDNILLRTQTSGMQIRSIYKKKPPIRFISSGKVYRNDYDNTHTPMFHQMEGVIIDTHINLSILKSILYDFLKNFFKKKIFIRFRSSYFPFTEPSAEIDIIKNKKWIEILGCGIIHPNILKEIKINSKKYTGCAFGLGIERLTMIYYNINDVRLFFENDLSFLKQFNF